jgi:N-hydroxyarylamine O-acetyltransferase
MASGDRPAVTPNDDSASLDLDAYLNRVEYTGDVRPSAENLRALHLAHATHIPFENLDVLLKRPIRLDVYSLQAKLVAACRGGYCFEQNLLFAAVLRALGFAVKPLAARVRLRTTRILPRTHMLLLVETDGERWIADVGFGGEGLLWPVPLVRDEPAVQFLWTYQVGGGDGEWTLQSLRQGAWVDLYAFTEEPQVLADFEMANYYVSTHPDSRFVQTLTVQLPTPRERLILRNRELTFDRGDALETRMLESEAELFEVLRDVFALPVPADARLLTRDAP